MALTTNTQTYASGILNIAQGKVVTDSGAAADTSFDIGFVPRYVEWVNATDRVTEQKYDGMAAADVIHTAADGVRTLNTGSLVQFLGTGATDTVRGFKVLAAVIVASKTHYWRAIG